MHGLKPNVTDELPKDCRHIRLPLYALSILACTGKRPWSDAELTLDNLPPRIAKCTFEMKGGVIMDEIYIRFIPFRMEHSRNIHVHKT